MEAPTLDSSFPADCSHLTNRSLQKPFFGAHDLGDGAWDWLLVDIGFDWKAPILVMGRALKSITRLLLMNSKIPPAACKILKYVFYYIYY
jgi:hypothetical protein